MKGCTVPLKNVQKEEDRHHIKELWISQLGYVMAAVFDPEKKITCNYVVGNIKDFIPKGYEIDETKEITPI